MIRAALRIYAAILHLYPAAFRERCGAPMLRTFEEWCRTARAGRSTPGFARACGGEFLDAIGGAWRSRRPHPSTPAIGRDESWPAALMQDGFYAFRRLTSQPALVAFTVVTLGFAIAANAALFSIVDAVLLRPSPFAGSDRLFQIINL